MSRSLRAEANGRLRLRLPTPPGICTNDVIDFHSAITDEATSVNKFVVMPNEPGSRNALCTGSIGLQAHPGAAAYHTFGTERHIRIRNHLKTTLYAAVSGAGRSGNSQYSIKPGGEEDWSRSEANVRVHLSKCISDTGEQIVRVCAARSGMVLHIQDLGEAMWQGM